MAPPFWREARVASLAKISPVLDNGRQARRRAFDYEAGMQSRLSIGHDAPSMPLPTRNFLGNQFVYCVLSQRAGGLSVGINMNPDKRCNFDCVYCEVDRRVRGPGGRVKVATMAQELERVLEAIHAGRLADLGYPGVSPDMLPFREVALSGDGEPTLCPNFHQVVEAVVHLRERHVVPFFKLVLITNAIGLDFPEVRAGLELFAPADEVWAKLDAGTQAYMDEVNQPGVPIDMILRSICRLGRKRPVIIQSLFPSINGSEPSDAEIAAYALNLLNLHEAGARIPLVQIYSAHRTPVNPACRHLPLRTLAHIAHAVRETTGLNAEVF